jgi:hypothetical protein
MNTKNRRVPAKSASGPLTELPAGHPYLAVGGGKFMPDGANPTYWALTKPIAAKLLLENFLRRQDRDDSQSAFSRRSCLCRYLVWVAENDPDLLTTDPLDLDEIRRYLATEAVARRATYRSRQALGVILRSFRPGTPKSIVPRPTSIPPVEDDLFEHALAVVANFRGALTRSNTRALLLLSRATGIDGYDLRYVIGNDVVKKPGAGTWVRVRAPHREREIPVLARFADQIEDLALAAGDHPMISKETMTPVESSKTSHIVINLNRAISKSGRSGSFQVAGLRKAWIAEQLACNAPLLSLVPATGLTSLRAFEDLFREHSPKASTNPLHLARELGGIE